MKTRKSLSRIKHREMVPISETVSTEVTENVQDNQDNTVSTFSARTKALLNTALGNTLLCGGVALGIYGMNSLEDRGQAELAARKQEIQKFEPVIGSTHCNRSTAASPAQYEVYKKFSVMLSDKYSKISELNDVGLDRTNSKLFCSYLNNPQFEASFENDVQFREQVFGFLQLSNEWHFWDDVTGLKWLTRILLVLTALGISITSLENLRNRLYAISKREESKNAKNMISSPVEQLKTVEQDPDALLRQTFDEIIAEMDRLLQKKNGVIAEMQSRFIGKNGGGAYRKNPAKDQQVDRLQKLRIALDKGDFKKAKTYFEFVLEEAEPTNDVEEDQSEAKTGS
jgi:hypothetical protein